mmetsp:Transcript_12413/g.16310  ORF Transcript_12413/g.16310 Transcript_12413/m.16310 type:complete len:122 (+) Transcript_12413:151-516(+)
MIRFVLLILALFSNASAFAPGRGLLTKANIRLFDNGARPSCVLRMAEGETEKKTAGGTDGTYYDDEVEPVQKEGISNTMRDRLVREASTGLNSEEKQTNVILYIMATVAVLVALGGAGILF